MLGFVGATALLTACSGVDTRPQYAWQTFTPVEKTAFTPETVRLVAQFEDLGNWVSQPSETKDAFLLRVGQSLQLYTRTTGYEGCGYIVGEKGGTAWSVHLTTNLSHFNCLPVLFVPDPALNALTETIHSHPNPEYGRSIRVSRDDKELNPMNGAISEGDHVQVESGDFSRQDFQRGTGYLVTKGKLLYQDTPAHRRTVGKVDADIAMVSPDEIPVIAGLQRRRSAAALAALETDPETVTRLSEPVASSPTPGSR
jgi:hypothetical protein